MDFENDQEQQLRWLETLRMEHRDLDVAINHLMTSRHHDNMRIQRLKRRKLKLKDAIHKLESELIPDLDA
ncbi:MAG: YdcH family protein [Candidatus Azotimanducaceae bacterium]